MSADSDGLRRRLQVALTAAMTAKEQPLVSVLRTTLAAIANAEAVGLPGDVARRHLGEDDVRAVVRRECDELSSAADEMEQVGHPDRAAVLRAQASALAAHLADR